MVTKEFLNTEETVALEEAAVCLRDQLLIRLLRRLGCRIGEVLGIEVPQIDFEGRNITIVHEKVRVNRKCPKCDERVGKKFKACPYCRADLSAVIKNIKNEPEFRNLPVDKKSLEMVKEYIDRGGAVQVGDKLMLFNMTRQRAWQIVTDCARRAGLPEIMNVKKQRVHHVSPHKLRDSFATNIANKDSSMASLKKLQEHLGHKDFNTTMRYVRVTGEQHREWYENMTDEEEEE